MRAPDFQSNSSYRDGKSVRQKNRVTHLQLFYYLSIDEGFHLVWQANGDVRKLLLLFCIHASSIFYEANKN